MMKRRDVPGRAALLALAVGALALGALAGCTQNSASDDPKPGSGTGSIGSHAVGAREGTAPAPGGAAPAQRVPDSRTAPKPRLD